MIYQDIPWCTFYLDNDIPWYTLYLENDIPWYTMIYHLLRQWYTMIYLLLRQWYTMIYHLLRKWYTFYLDNDKRFAVVCHDVDNKSSSSPLPQHTFRQYQLIQENLHEMASAANCDFVNIDIWQKSLKKVLPFWAPTPGIIQSSVFTTIVIHHTPCVQESLRKKKSMKKFNTFRLCQLIQRNEYSPIPFISIK